MGKKRIITKTEVEGAGDSKPKVGAAPTRSRLARGILNIRATYNNTKLLLADPYGNALFAGSSGSLGFKGAKKGTPFAAAKVAETLAAKATDMGISEVEVVVKGVGSGRESAIRAFANQGISITSIKDATPVPHNGPRPKKPRRV